MHTQTRTRTCKQEHAHIHAHKHTNIIRNKLVSYFYNIFAQHLKVALEKQSIEPQAELRNGYQLSQMSANLYHVSSICQFAIKNFSAHLDVKSLQIMQVRDVPAVCPEHLRFLIAGHYILQSF